MALTEGERARRYAVTPRGRYVRHKANANRRGVPFNLTFSEWWAIWQESGAWEKRGNRQGQYCMARNGDRGGYEVGNVRIVRMETNTAERNRSVVDRGLAGLGVTSSVVGGEEAPF